MRHRMYALILLVLFLASTSALAYPPKHWRVGGSYTQLTSEPAQSTFGNALGVGVEYSFSDRLTEDEDIPGDVSISAYYRVFDKTSNGVDRSIKYTSASIKWRGGAGANPGSEGLYGGVGAGAAWINCDPSLGLPGPHQTVVKFEWTVFAGVNYARWLFTEIGYSNADSPGEFGFGAINFTFGGRF